MGVGTNVPREELVGRPRPAFATETDMKLAQSDAPYQLAGQTFGTLTEAQRRHLLGWHDAARASGIDSIEDLTQRPWPQCNVDTIIGVFEADRLLATWLIVGQGGEWAVACCRDSTISEPVSTLADALQIVCPVAPTVVIRS